MRLVIVFTLVVGISHAYNTVRRSVQNATFPVYVSSDVNSKTVAVGQSMGVQPQPKPTELEQTNGIVSLINSKIPNSVSNSHYGSNNFGPSQAWSQFSGGFAPIGHNANTNTNVNAQRRIDPILSDDEIYNYAESELDGYKYNPMVESESDNTKQGNDDKYHPKPELDYEVPETREAFQAFQPSGPGPGFGFVGPAPFDPLPPPPTAIRGSVDYILIPLVLIGIAGPIFVVLYVILGAFEAKLAPITRSLGGFGSVQPYLDNLMSNVGRALDGDECISYAACRFGSFCNSLGYNEDLPLKKTLDAFTPQKYKRTVRQLFRGMKGNGNCSASKCLKMFSN